MALTHFWNCDFFIHYTGSTTQENQIRRVGEDPASVIENHERIPNRNLKLHKGQCKVTFSSDKELVI